LHQPACFELWDFRFAYQAVTSADRYNENGYNYSSNKMFQHGHAGLEPLSNVLIWIPAFAGMTKFGVNNCRFNRNGVKASKVDSISNTKTQDTSKKYQRACSSREGIYSRGILKMGLIHQCFPLIQGLCQPSGLRMKNR
jgi:hypothetical protein